MVSKKEFKFSFSKSKVAQPINGLEHIINEEILQNFYLTIVKGRDLQYLLQIQPGIFITGGTARAIALKESCKISEQQISPPTDVDWITLSDKKIYVKKSVMTDERRNIPANQNTPKLLKKYFDQTDFGVDALFVGRFNENDEPTIYMAPSAKEAYSKRTIDFTPNYVGLDKNVWGRVTNISNQKAALRALLFELRLGKHGFKNKIDSRLIKKALERDWDLLLRDYSVLDYVSRAKHDRNMFEYIELLREYGFTVPKNIIQYIESYSRSNIVEMIINARS